MMENLMAPILDKLVRYRESAAVLTVMLALLSYIIYQYWLMCYDIKLNELYFSSSTFCIFMFSFLTFTYMKKRLYKSLMIIGVSFFFFLDFTYIFMWILLGKPIANIRESLILGVLFSIIYWINGAIKHLRSTTS